MKGVSVARLDELSTVCACFFDWQQLLGLCVSWCLSLVCFTLPPPPAVVGPSKEVHVLGSDERAQNSCVSLMGRACTLSA